MKLNHTVKGQELDSTQDIQNLWKSVSYPTAHVYRLQENGYLCLSETCKTRPQKISVGVSWQPDHKKVATYNLRSSDVTNEREYSLWVYGLYLHFFQMVVKPFKKNGDTNHKLVSFVSQIKVNDDSWKNHKA